MYIYVYIYIYTGLVLGGLHHIAIHYHAISTEEGNLRRVCQKQISKAGISNYIPQILWDVILTFSCPWYLSSDTQVFNWVLMHINTWPQDFYELLGYLRKVFWLVKTLFKILNTQRNIEISNFVDTNMFVDGWALFGAGFCAGTVMLKSGAMCNMRYPSETHLKLKSRKISFVHNIRFSCPFVLKFCREYGSITAVLCTKFQNDWIIKKYVMGKQDLTRFEF